MSDIRKFDVTYTTPLTKTIEVDIDDVRSSMGPLGAANFDRHLLAVEGHVLRNRVKFGLPEGAEIIGVDVSAVADTTPEV